MGERVTRAARGRRAAHDPPLERVVRADQRRRDGHPGVAAWQTFKDQLQALALAPLGAAGQLIGGGEPNDEHDFDVNIGQAYVLRRLGPADWRRAAASTFTVLAQRFHSTDPASWRESRMFFPQTALGAEQPPPMPFFDRGTFEQVVELGP